MDQDRRRFAPSRLSLKQWGVVAGVWVLALGAAVGIAVTLDDPVGSGARDRATPIVAGPVVAPGQELTASDDGLPPLAMFLPRVSPAAIARLSADERAQAVATLQARADERSDPTRLSQLGVALQASSDGPSAQAAYQAALRQDPGHVPSRIGLAMVDAAAGSAGLQRADRALVRLARELPRNQLVAFNRGWLALYRRDGDTAVAEWERAIGLGPNTSLGRTAARFRDASREQSQGPNP